MEGAAVQRGVSDVRADGHGGAHDAAVVAVIATGSARVVVVVVVVRRGWRARGVDVPGVVPVFRAEQVVHSLSWSSYLTPKTSERDGS